MNNQISGLDLLRTAAITMVFLFHYTMFPHPAWLDVVSTFGWTGVDLFFVLSGYLIASQVFSKLSTGDFSLREFFIKRTFRILPAYWVVLALYFTIPMFREWSNLPPLWRFLTFTQNFGLDLSKHRAFSHAWSLCVEEQYYLFFPFAVLALSRLKRPHLAVWLIAALVLVGIGIRLLSWNMHIAPLEGSEQFGRTWYKYMYYPTYNRLDGLLASITIAWIMQYAGRLGNWLKKYSNILLVTGLIIAIATFMLFPEQHSIRASVLMFPLIALAYALIVAAMVTSNKGKAAIASYWFSKTAALSYGIYLVHKAIIHLTQLQSSVLHIAPDCNAMLVLSIITTTLAALLLHYIIERPFMALRVRLINAMRVRKR